MLKEWIERPQDVSNLLNPAFLGLLLYRAIVGFQKEASRGMPLELAVLVLPFVLHPATRKKLPTKVTTLPTWVQLHREVLVDYPKRTRSLLPFTKESLSFLLDRNVLVFDEDGAFGVGTKRPSRVTQYQQIDDEIAECYRKAEFVGKWLASAGSSSTIYILLGIRP